jgi:ketosteroid isomerase-like protein
MVLLMRGPEVVGRALDDWRRGGLEAWSRSLHPNVRWDTSVRGVDGGVVHGPAAVMQVSREWLDAWEALTFEVRELREAGEQVAVRFHQHGRGRGSGIEGELEWFASLGFRDDKIVAYREHVAWSDALEAIGLDK